jgi:hypothetical protein
MTDERLTVCCWACWQLQQYSGILLSGASVFRPAGIFYHFQLLLGINGGQVSITAPFTITVDRTLHLYTALLHCHQ